MTETKVFDKFSIIKGDGQHLSAILMRPPRGKIERLLYIVPLAGSGASQQILRFRALTRGGSALLSFEYQGHGRSGGTFSIEKTLEDAETVLLWACEHAAKGDLPLHVLSTCYSAIPLLSCFRNRPNRFGVRSLSGVASLFDLNHIIRLDNFLLRYFRDGHGRAISPSQFIQRIRSGIIDRDGDIFRNSVKDFLKGLFPELNITRDSFEELQFSRIDIPETMEQISQMRPLAGVRLPDNIPCFFLYGRRDALMGLDAPAGRSRYESRVRSIAPHARILSVDTDHYGRGPDHDVVIRELHRFFEEHDGGPGVPSEGPHTRAVECEDD